MVEVQESKEEQENEETQEFSDKYLQRRGIDTSSPFTSRLVDIGYTDSEDRIAARLKTPDFDFIVYLGYGENPMNSDIVDFLAECPRQIVSDEEVNQDTKFDVWISDDLRRFGFDKNSKKYKIEIKDIPELDGSSKDIIKSIYPYYKYRRMSGEKPGVLCNVKDVKGVSEEEFKITVDLTADKEIQWFFDIPFQVDIDEHPVAELIEEHGNGDPLNLGSNSELYVVHKSDLIGRVHPVGFDTTEEWAILTASEYKNWSANIQSESFKKPMSRSILTFIWMYLLYVIIATLTLILLTRAASILT